MQLPESLRALELAVVADVACSELRHLVRAKLQSVANATYFLEGQVSSRTSLFAEDPRVPRFFSLLGTSVDSLCGDLGPHHAPAPQPASPIDVAPVLEEVTHLFLPEGHLELEQPARLRAAVDPHDLQLAVAQLVDNALDAAPPDDAARIVLRAHDDGEGPVVEVIDQGTGLSPAVLERALEPYFSTKPGHLGLGLNVARALARRWGGDVDLAPLGAGARACLRLPREGARRSPPGAGV